MSGHLNLVESDFEKMEKIVLPRFPFCYLTFKDSVTDSHVFEVQDISVTGMQLRLRNGEHSYEQAKDISGSLSWLGQKLAISGEVRWSNENRLGVEFINNPHLNKDISDFLKVDNLVKALKPVHKVDYGTALPANLKYWLSADGPVQLLVWLHPHGEISNFQIIIMEHFVEWVDGSGLRSGRVISKRDKDTPLISSDEFVFSIDQIIDDNKIELAKDLVSKLIDSKIPEDTLKFLKLKLGL